MIPSVRRRRPSDPKPEPARVLDRFELLDRATPWQILAASRGATGPLATRHDVDRSWERLRGMVTL